MHPLIPFKYVHLKRQRKIYSNNETGQLFHLPRQAKVIRFYYSLENNNLMVNEEGCQDREKAHQILYGSELNQKQQKNIYNLEF